MKKTEAKNHATSGRRSTGSTGSMGNAGSLCTASARVAGRRKAATSRSASIAATKPGKMAMPTLSSKAPKAVTETMKPIEPHTRTRP